MSADMLRFSSHDHAGVHTISGTFVEGEWQKPTTPNAYEHPVGQRKKIGTRCASRCGEVYEGLRNHARLVTSPRHWLQRTLRKKSRQVGESPWLSH